MKDNIRKIYIIGPVGSGKTTLANKLSKKLNIKMYELDKVVWDDDNGNIKRDLDDINKRFKIIIDKSSWIIEDVGRKKFREGIKKADIVYYLNLNKTDIYKRCITRWIKQKIGIEKFNYNPTLKGLIQMLSWAKNDIRNKEEKIEYIKKNSKKYKILTKKEIKKNID